MNKCFVLRNTDIILNVTNAIAIAFRTGELFEVIIRPFKSQRSLAQNRLYWKWLKIIGDTFGNSDDAMHEYFKARMLKPAQEKVLGEWTAIYPTTTKLKVGEFTEYLQKIEEFAMNHNIILPHPDDYHIAHGVIVAERVCFDTLPQRDGNTMGGEVRV